MSNALTQEEFEKRVYNARPYIEILSGEYKNMDSYFQVKDKVCGHVWPAKAKALVKAQGCPKCCNAIKDTTDDFVKKMAIYRPTITVLGKYENNHTKVLCKCNVCGHEWPYLPMNMKKAGCPVCSNRVIIPGYNDFNTAHPELVKYLKNPEDGETFAPNTSNKSIVCKCPDCGSEHPVLVSNLVKAGFSCRKCSDGISYPNKFIRAMLDQLIGYDYETEYQEDWCEDYYYDNYFEYNNKKYFVEVDGGFHYNEHKISNRSLKDVQQTDLIKDQLAMQHDIIMIRIDCRISDSEYIKQSVENSLLNSLFDLSIVNWIKCDEIATSSYIKYCCEFYENNKFDIDFHKICSILHVSNTTLLLYLRQGRKFKWCNTSHKERVKLSKKFQTISNAKPIRVYKNNEWISDCKSINDCERFMKNIGEQITSSTISRYIDLKYGMWNEYRFEYI